MSLEEKIKNAKTVTWLTDGLTDEELEKIREEAQRQIEKTEEHFSDTNIEFKENMSTMSPRDKEVLVQVLTTYSDILHSHIFKDEDATFMNKYNDFYYMVIALEGIIGDNLTRYI